MYKSSVLLLSSVTLCVLCVLCGEKSMVDASNLLLGSERDACPRAAGAAFPFRPRKTRSDDAAKIMRASADAPAFGAFSIAPYEHITLTSAWRRSTVTASMARSSAAISSPGSVTRSPWPSATSTAFSYLLMPSRKVIGSRLERAA